MSLKKYHEKRNLSNTPEPGGGKSSDKQLIFVIQKHAASHLHYDFRLEMEGVLKSWAVPKGPSLDPSVKRLAMMVEDHPYDYKDFEGVIPKGNYGAGNVIIWDQGVYTPLAFDGTKKEKEKYLLAGLKKGEIKILMLGKKLKGEFVLVKTSGRGENSWLLIKHRDEYATDKDISLKNKSVVSGKTVETISEGEHRTWKSNRSQAADEKPEKKAVKKTAVKSKTKTVATKRKTASVKSSALVKKTVKKAAKKSVKKGAKKTAAKKAKVVR